MLVVGGWFDNEDLYGPLKTYRSIEKHNPKATNTLVMGPWAHGGWLRMTGESSAEPWLDPPDRGGQQALVRAEVLRGRFRDSFEKPLPFEPDRVTPISFELLDVLHTFKRGHRIMVQLQSTWFPYIDRNPQSWVPNIFEAQEKDFIRATHTVHRTSAAPSHIEVLVLP